MRTTIDLPDELYRTLKTRAAIKGVTLRELVQDLIEQGLHEGDRSGSQTSNGRPPLVVAIPAQGLEIKLTAQDIHELEIEDDRKRLG